MKNLVIVESPSKSKTIEKYLGKDYKVTSSMGHIRDLTTSGKYGLGVDIDNGFKPNYEIIKGKKKLVTELKKMCKESEKVYLASDPDREGEAIAFHLKDTLKLKDKDYDRVLFNEITHDKVLEAFNTPRKIDDNLVDSQEARRILDRIIGFRLSKLMQSKTGGKSAGRVQSVALKLIVDREREINDFVPEEYYIITAYMKDFEAELYQYNNKDYKIKTKVECDDVLSKLTKSFKILDVTSKEKKKASKYPFTTSTLQQEASNKLNFTGKKTMSIAQKLYEGIDLKNERLGLITYMRTDSVRLSDEFVKDTFKYIKDNYGDDYMGYVKRGKNTENVQDAHEAIRPTSIKRTPESVKEYLTNDEYKLYKFIYTRALSSLMSDSINMVTTIILDNNNYQFKATGQVLTFDGYLKAYSDYEDNNDKILPDYSNYKTNVVIAEKIEGKQHFTSPKQRYTESKLIKELEELGIGRPSTYVKIIDTIKERGYVTLKEKKFYPTDIGITTTDKLQEGFSSIINVTYTAKMEKDLDEVAEGKEKEVTLLTEFWNEFEPMVQDAFKKMEKAPLEETGEQCPLCNSPLVKRRGKFGEFIGCSNYPECKYIKKDEKKVVEIMDCPSCNKGKIIEKKTKRGKIFYGCNNYPECKFASWDRPVLEKCPLCGNVLTIKKDKLKCIACDFEK